ncbi:MAG: transposase [Candidatus Yanofskybacteria bacterium]|nr:transposase [Candidatus Yanofskybacteria bacterium]
MNKNHHFIDPIDSREYDFAIGLLRDFFKKSGFTEAAVQHRLSILSACEDPFNVATFNYAGEVWPLPQTGQMWLEHELLHNPKEKGFFCVTTSYRQEPDPKPGRHNLIFPMFEFEFKGSMDILRKLEADLLRYVGFRKKTKFPGGKYKSLAKSYGTEEITGEHEIKIKEKFGSVYFLEYFPEYTSPFWNMKRQGDVAKKIDVILHGIETIGSAERSTSAKEMRDRFYNISEGAYAKTLFAKFTKARVEKELEDFLSLKFFPRSGGGIGMNRWIRALKLEGLMSDTSRYPTSPA